MQFGAPVELPIKFLNADNELLLKWTIDTKIDPDEVKKTIFSRGEVPELKRWQAARAKKAHRTEIRKQNLLPPTRHGNAPVSTQAPFQLKDFPCNGTDRNFWYSFQENDLFFVTLFFWMEGLLAVRRICEAEVGRHCSGRTFHQAPWNAFRCFPRFVLINNVMSAIKIFRKTLPLSIKFLKFWSESLPTNFVFDIQTKHSKKVVLRNFQKLWKKCSRMYFDSRKIVFQK